MIVTVLYKTSSEYEVRLYNTNDKTCEVTISWLLFNNCSRGHILFSRHGGLSGIDSVERLRIRMGKEVFIEGDVSISATN